MQRGWVGGCASKSVSAPARPVDATGEGTSALDKATTTYYVVVVSARRVTTFRIDDELMEGMQLVWERDGVAVSEQVRRAIRAWLEAKGVNVKSKEGKRAATRKRR